MFDGNWNTVWYLGLALIIIGAALGAWDLLRLLRGRKAARREAKAVARAGILSSVILGFLSVILIAFGIAAVSVAAVFFMYRGFEQEDLVAIVRCYAEPESQAFKLVFIPVEGGKPHARVTYEIVGDRWLLLGDIVRWRKYLTFLGFNTSHKISRIQGVYLDQEKETSELHTAFDIDGGTDEFPRKIAKKEDAWPYTLFVRSAYYNGVGDFPLTPEEKNKEFRIFITPGGYTLKKQTREDR